MGTTSALKYTNSNVSSPSNKVGFINTLRQVFPHGKSRFEQHAPVDVTISSYNIMIQLQYIVTTSSYHDFIASITTTSSNISVGSREEGQIEAGEEGSKLVAWWMHRSSRGRVGAVGRGPHLGR
jgi:hypothetical protein